MTTLLAHPMVLLLVGALLSGLILPLVTRRWTLQQNELKIRLQLVTDVAHGVTTVVVSADYLERAVIRHHVNRYSEDKELLDALSKTMKERDKELVDATKK